MAAYPILLVLHLFAALLFIGTVFFEVLILEAIRRKVPRHVMCQVEGAITRRARAIMPWALLVLYGTGLGMAWHYRAVLAHPFASPMALMLALKIVLALSVAGHFLVAMGLLRRGRIGGSRSRRLHVSLFWHMVLIVLLAKAMFHLGL